MSWLLRVCGSPISYLVVMLTALAATIHSCICARFEIGFCAG
ncbi:hypothetical protein [Arthrobacter methylotrophus]